MKSYQYNYSNNHKYLYNYDRRLLKAKKIYKILTHYLKKKINNSVLLDIGSSTGIIDFYLSKKVKKVIGVDIDKNAVKYAKKNFKSKKLNFVIADAMLLPFPENSFDIIICAHVYEHVPNASKLIDEIYRILKPNGICFFAAENKLLFMEPHYNLPFLSLLPKFLANIYLRIFKKGNYYYENLKTLWEIKSLIKKFKVTDYTKLSVFYPNIFYSYDQLRSHFVHFVAKYIVKYFYFLFPTYLFILQKKDIDK